MIRKDKLLLDFLNHSKIKEYNIPKSELKLSVQDAMRSNYPIVKSIAMIVNELEKSSPTSDNELNKIIKRMLNDLE